MGLPVDTIVRGDCLEELKKLPDRSVDLVFADPPYNLQLGGDLLRPDNSKVDAVDDDWDKFESFADLRRLHPRLAEGMPSRAEGRRRPVGDRQLSQHLPLRRGAAGPGLLDPQRHHLAQVQPDAELQGHPVHQRPRDADLGVQVARQPRYTFNYDAMKMANDELQMRSDWTFALCTGDERLKDDAGTKAHPTQKPEALLHRVICGRRSPGDVVLDPFFGTGTTGAVAKRLGRHFIGIEREAEYANIAEARIAKVIPATAEELLVTGSKRSEPKVPFGSPGRGRPAAGRRHALLPQGRARGPGAAGR
jgi:modification methylase